jgi:hypothetical protein
MAIAGSRISFSPSTSLTAAAATAATAAVVSSRLGLTPKEAPLRCAVSTSEVPSAADPSSSFTCRGGSSSKNESFIVKPSSSTRGAAYLMPLASDQQCMTQHQKKQHEDFYAAVAAAAAAAAAAARSAVAVDAGIMSLSAPGSPEGTVDTGSSSHSSSDGSSLGFSRTDSAATAAASAAAAAARAAAAIHQEQILADIRHFKTVNETLMNCVVCLDAVRSVVLLPCKHLAVCQDCAERILQQGAPGNISPGDGSSSSSIGHCPICRAEVESHIPGVVIA